MNRVLLVVDDDQDIGDLFKFVVRKSFDKIFVVHSSAEAEQVIAANAVTHLVCDLSIGPDEPLGSKLVARWRRSCPSIKFAAVFTGAADRSAEEKLGDVDALYLKPSGFDALIERLRSATA